MEITFYILWTFFLEYPVAAETRKNSDNVLVTEAFSHVGNHVMTTLKGYSHPSLLAQVSH